MNTRENRKSHVRKRQSPLHKSGKPHNRSGGTPSPSSIAYNASPLSFATSTPLVISPLSPLQPADSIKPNPSSKSKRSDQLSVTKTKTDPSSPQKKPLKKTTTLLAFPDGPIDAADDDVYTTKIGGIPRWFSNSPSSYEYALCGSCGRELYLLAQAYVPLDASAYDRAIYVWACNQQQCMRRRGSFRAIRAHRINKEYAKWLEREKQLRANAAASSSFGSDNLLGDNPAANGITRKTNTDKTGSSSNSKKNWSEIVSAGISSSTTADLTNITSNLSKMTLNPSIQAKKPWPLDPPHFPAQYLYITEEILNSNPPSIDPKNLKYLNQVDEHGGEWADEKYEKAALPKGVDKAFKRFLKRVAEWPEQCIRYEFNGQPLLYNQRDEVANTILNSPSSIERCGNCNGQRVFEFQLMPNILPVLPVSGDLELKNLDLTTQRKDKTEKGGLDIRKTDLGMEWGTILVYTCARDCDLKTADDVNEESTTYFEEICLVQHEEW